MSHFTGKPIFELAVSKSKEFLKGRVDDFNSTSLERKRAEMKKKMSDDELERIKLDPPETAGADVSVSNSEASSTLQSHLQSVERWSTKVGFADLRGTKTLSDIYIQLDTYLTPSRLHLDSVEREQTIPLENAIFEENDHCIVLGQPGAGKTTSMKRLCMRLLSNQQMEKYAFPLLIKFRDLPPSTHNDGVILNELKAIIPLKFRFTGPLEEKETELTKSFKDRSFLIFLNALKPLIILEGFDEYPNNSAMVEIANEIRKLTSALTSSKVVVTCRTGEFNYSLDNSRTFEIANLKREQIEMFASRWIGNEVDKNRFVSDLYSSPFADTAIKPLSLAHLCAIYERIGQIPDRPKTVYRKIVGLLLEEWDQQRSIRRQSKYAKFEADRKFEFLSHLAFYLTTQTRRSVFSQADFFGAYEQIHTNFGLDESETKLVVAEIESHTGLFLQSAYEQYEFAHKSIQEYLTAEYIVKLPSIPRRPAILQSLGAELAIAVAISSNPSSYISDLVLNVLSRNDLPPQFYDAFVNRLVLEKPDFYQDTTVILSFFALLTLWINMGKHVSMKNAQRRITVSDHNQYNKLLSLIVTKNPAHMISKYYDFVNPDGDGDIYHVRRKGLIDGFKLPTYLSIPKSLVDQHLPDWPSRSAAKQQR
ncbi:NACHT domain-containing protein [Bradyrhizobium roseum]|uniref:NACHT domain-containing protein n=1 Tax=Bradyrhizobium roseum TaxID=3056648 RepID=UPI002635CA28|nr:NACHT domain-containing protein [Bradyrhizobium roseus]WKA31797.1 NACHT domain-containing protein [Bradyrhizobium roseus]